MNKLYILDPRIYIGKFLFNIIDNRIDKSLDINNENEFISYRWFGIIDNKEDGFNIEDNALSMATNKYIIFDESKKLFAWYYSIRYFHLLIRHSFLK